MDDLPVALGDYLSGMAKRIGASPPRSAPRALARLALGRYLTDVLTGSFVTTNARFRRDFAWTPRHPTYREGLDQIVAAWKAEGFPPTR